MATDPNDFDATPDPDATPTITLAQGGAISSATSSNLNTDLNFDQDQSLRQTADTVSDILPETDNNTTISVNIAQRDQELILNNVLNDYIDVMYNFSLAMVDKAAADSLRADTIQKNPITAEQYLVFASTAEAKTTSATTPTMGSSHDLNFYGDYYNIQAFSFTNIVGHFPQNPMVAVAWDGRMKMYEPYGFKFREDVNEMAQALGYPNLTSPALYVYRLELWFSGWDPRTGAWTPQIGIPCPQPGDSGKILKSIVYYLTITTVDAKVTATGTHYELSFQTFSHNVTRPEYIMFHQEDIGKGGTSINGHAKQTFGSFLQEVGNRLQAQILNDTQKKINVTFKFTGLKALFDAEFTSSVNVDFSKGVSFKSGDGFHASSAQGMDLYTLAHNLMKSLDLVRELWLRPTDKQFTQPTVAWNIRTNIRKQENPDKDTNIEKDYEFEYIFEPVLSYRSRLPPTVQDYNEQIKTGSQIDRVKQMLDYGMLVRWYDFLFVGDNSEIIDFQFQFKNFYFMQIPYPGVETSLRGQAHMTADSKKTDGVSGRTLEQNASASQQIEDIASPNLAFTPSSASSLDFSSLLNLTSPPTSQTQRGNNTMGQIHSYQHRGPITFTGGDVSASAEAIRINHAIDDYLRFEMMNAAMTVRGDPTWMMNSYMAGGDFTPTTNSKTDSGSTVFVNMDRVIYLNAFAPNQPSFMNPDASVFNVRETPILGGFYQVTQVINEFEGGKFTQKLSMIKYPHLNYYGQTSNNDAGIQQTPSNETTTAFGGVSNITNDTSTETPL